MSLVLASVSVPSASLDHIWRAYLALPGQVEFVHATPVEGNQKMCARVSVGQGQFGIAHLLAGGLCRALSVFWIRAEKERLRGGLTPGLAATKANGLLDAVGNGHGECAGRGCAIAGAGAGEVDGSGSVNVKYIKLGLGLPRLGLANVTAPTRRPPRGRAITRSDPHPPHRAPL